MSQSELDHAWATVPRDVPPTPAPPDTRSMPPRATQRPPRHAFTPGDVSGAVAAAILVVMLVGLVLGMYEITTWRP